MIHVILLLPFTLTLASVPVAFSAYGQVPTPSALNAKIIPTRVVWGLGKNVATLGHDPLLLLQQPANQTRVSPSEHDNIGNGNPIASVPFMETASIHPTTIGTLQSSAPTLSTSQSSQSQISRDDPHVIEVENELHQRLDILCQSIQRAFLQSPPSREPQRIFRSYRFGLQAVAQRLLRDPKVLRCIDVSSKARLKRFAGPIAIPYTSGNILAVIDDIPKLLGMPNRPYLPVIREMAVFLNTLLSQVGGSFGGNFSTTLNESIEFQQAF